MTRSMRGSVATAILVAAALLTTVVAQGKKQAVHVDSAKAEFKELATGASTSVLWGDMNTGPYAAFTKFTPGADHALHTHTNDIRIVVLEGAYLYKPEKGEAVRVEAGQFLFIPGGDRHASGGDAEKGALFYTESPGKFDLNFVK